MCNDIDSTPVAECNAPSMNDTGKPDSLHNKASFLLKLKEERRISQRAINGIVDYMNTLFEQELAVLKEEVTSCFAGTNNTMGEVKKIFEQKMSVPFFHNLDSEHLQKAYYTTQFNYVVSPTCS